VAKAACLLTGTGWMRRAAINPTSASVLAAPNGNAALAYPKAGAQRWLQPARPTAKAHP